MGWNSTETKRWWNVFEVCSTFLDNDLVKIDTKNEWKKVLKMDPKVAKMGQNRTKNGTKGDEMLSIFIFLSDNNLVNLDTKVGPWPRFSSRCAKKI